MTFRTNIQSLFIASQYFYGSPFLLVQLHLSLRFTLITSPLTHSLFVYEGPGVSCLLAFDHGIPLVWNVPALLQLPLIIKVLAFP